MAAYTTTLAGQYISPLVLPEQQNDFTVRYVLPYTAMSVASSATSTDTLTVTLGTTTANWVCSGAYAFTSTPVCRRNWWFGNVGRHDHHGFGFLGFDLGDFERRNLHPTLHWLEHHKPPGEQLRLVLGWRCGGLHGQRQRNDVGLHAGEH